MIPHLPAVQADWPCVGAGQALPQLPQLVSLELTSTQAPPHTVPLHVGEQKGAPDDESHVGDGDVHVVEHEPQWLASFSAVSHPSVGSPLQSP